MKAISLSRPWPWAILHSGKRLENRKRKDGRMPHICRHRGPLLLHAAQSWDDSAIPWMREHELLRNRVPLIPLLPSNHPAGRIFARCTAVGHIEPWECDTCGDWPPKRRGQCPDCEGTLTKDDDLSWWMGGYALMFVDVEPTPLVRCRGYQGLWTPPPEVLDQLGAKP